MITEEEEQEFNAGVRRHRAEVARRETMAAEGDVDGVWAELTRPRPGAFDPAEFFPLLLKAVEVRAHRSPEHYSAEILAKMVALVSYLTLRSHFLLAARVEQYDHSPQGRGRVELPPAFTERVIPQLLALQESLGQTLHTQAAVTRAWELARAKKLENDRAAGKTPGKPGGKAKPKARRKPGSAPAHVNGNGKHNGGGKPGGNRIAGLRDGLGSKTDGEHHDE